MAQTIDGSKKIAAKKAGVTLEQYEHNCSIGRKWCTNCKEWHDKSLFGKDISKWDNLTASCTNSRRAKAKASYTPKPRPPRGRSFVPARDGDKKQARRRVNFLVESGLLPNPNSVACTDCGHVTSPNSRRHEYDHFLGYCTESHEKVQAVCTKCHHKRETERNL